MATTTLKPETDELTTGWSITGTPSTHSECLDEGIGSANDATDNISTGGTDTFKTTLSAIPGSFASANTADFSLRYLDLIVRTGRAIHLQIFQSDGVTAITDEESTTLSSASWVTITGSLTISGTNSAAAWTDAQLHMRITASGAVTTTRVTVVDIELDYSTSAATAATKLYHYRRLREY